MNQDQPMPPDAEKLPEGSGGRVLRILAWIAMIPLAMVGLVGSVAFGCLWLLTACESFQCFILGKSQPPFLNSNQTFAVEQALGIRLWELPRLLIAMDISSFASFIAMLSSFVLLRGSVRTLTRPIRDRGQFLRYGYRDQADEIFDEDFCRSMVRYGLLGNLTSFFGVGLHLIRNLDLMSPVQPDQVGAVTGMLGSQQLTLTIFLALTASLTSTLCGTTVAYLIGRNCNRINDWALGVHQLGLLPDADPFESIRSTVEDLKSEMFLLAASVKAVIPAMQDLPRFFESADKVLATTRTHIEAWAGMAAQMKNAIDQLSSATTSVNEIPAVLRSELGNLHQQIAMTNKAIGQLIGNMESMCGEFSGSVSKIESSLAPVASIPEDVKRSADAFAGLKEGVEQLLQSATTVLNQLAGTLKQTEQLNKLNASVNQSTVSLNQERQGLFRQFSLLTQVFNAWEPLFIRLEQHHGDEISELQSQLAELRKLTKSLESQMVEDRLESAEQASRRYDRPTQPMSKNGRTASQTPHAAR